MNAHRLNLARLAAVYQALGKLREEVVFIGGATVSLYATYPAAAEEVRPTKDVDVVVPGKAYPDYAAVEDYLRSRGFCNDIESGIICRYTFGGLVVDVMPAYGDFLGFQNRWYAEGFIHSVPYSLSEKEVIRIFSAPYFLASKLEAFAGRGKNDGRWSSDFEDLVYVLNNRTTVWQECTEAPQTVRAYLGEKFASLLQRPSLEEWLSVHLEYAFAKEQARKIESNMRAFVEENLF